MTDDSTTLQAAVIVQLDFRNLKLTRNKNYNFLKYKISICLDHTYMCTLYFEFHIHAISQPLIVLLNSDAKYQSSRQSNIKTRLLTALQYQQYFDFLILFVQVFVYIVFEGFFFLYFLLLSDGESYAAYGNSTSKELSINRSHDRSKLKININQNYIIPSLSITYFYSLLVGQS